MKKSLFQQMIMTTWVMFFFDFNKVTSIWDILRVLLGLLAVYCTVEAMKTEVVSGSSASMVSRIVMFGVVFPLTVLICLLVFAVHAYLPAPYANLLPFIVIISVSFISMVFANFKPEESERNLVPAKGARQEE